MKKKVLHILPSFAVGGAEKVVLDYLNYFDKEKVDIRALSMYSESGTPYDEKIEDENMNVYYLEKKPGLDFSMFRKIEKILEEYNPDVIHSHMHTLKYILPYILRKKNKKFFHTIHNEPEKDAIGLDKLANIIGFRFGKVVPIALTDTLKKSVDNYYKLNNTIVVRNGINLDDFKNISINQEEAKKRLNIPSNSFVVGHIGRFSKQKNHLFILDVFSHVLKQNPRSYLVLIGDGELLDDAKNKAKGLGISSNVNFLGIRKDIPEIMKAMDVFLFPSLHEGFPIVLMEAQATGIRSVISNTIDKNSVLSSKTISVGLEETPKYWSNIILDTQITNKEYENIDNYDISKITKKLLEVYDS